ncbi:MAG: hypothetical protein HZA90_07430 [Verrucomicrobia bacterium]|nr:hypothetical protein [Verrucomicrobiota bacterium]
MNVLVLGFAVGLFFAGFAATGQAFQVAVPVDTNASTLRVQLCVNPAPLAQRCDEETHPLRGTLVLGLDDDLAPAHVALRDFDLQATADYSLVLDWGFFIGKITAIARNLRLYHAQPGPTNAPAPVANGQFVLTNVPCRASGTTEYRISGALCSLIAGSFPCSSNVDLSTMDGNAATNVPGSILVSNGVIHVRLDLPFSTPLNATNADFGVLRGHAVVRGSAPVPPRMDAVAAGTNVVVRWPSAAPGQLYQATDLREPIQWTPVPTSPEDDGTTKSVRQSSGRTNRFFRLVCP